LDGKHVVFGRVVKGYRVLKKIETVSVDEKFRPTVDVVIVDSGELTSVNDRDHDDFKSKLSSQPRWISSAEIEFRKPGVPIISSMVVVKPREKETRCDDASNHDLSDMTKRDLRHEIKRIRETEPEMDRTAHSRRRRIQADERNETPHRVNDELDPRDRSDRATERKPSFEASSYVPSYPAKNVVDPSPSEVPVIKFKGRGRMKYRDIIVTATTR